MPRIVDHEERRRQICDVMLEIVAESGILGVTIRGVAEKSGWSTGVISHYFRNRHDLLLGGLRRAAELLGEHNSTILANLEGLAALEMIIEGSMPFDGRRLALARIFIFFYVEGMHDEGLRTEVEHYLLHWRKSATRAIRQAQAMGDLPTSLDAKQTASDLIGLADGVSMHALLVPDVLSALRQRSPIRFWLHQLGCAG